MIQNRPELQPESQPESVNVTGEVAGEVAGEVRKLYLVPALKAGYIEMTIPDKPNSRLQKYRLTDAGRAWLARKNS